MAEQYESGVSSTLVAESGGDFAAVCDPWHTEGQRVQASATGAISTNTPAEEKDPMTDRCTKHSGKLIKFYCNSHNILGCKVCVSVDHGSCKDVLDIMGISRGVTNSNVLKIKTDLHTLRARLTSIQHRTKWMRQEVEASYIQTVTDIRNTKKTVIDTLDKLETDILDMALVMKEENITALNSVISSCDVLIKESGRIITDLEEKTNMSDSRNYKLFIAMKTAKDNCHALDDDVNYGRNKRHYGRLAFQRSGKLTELISTLNSLGSVETLSAFVKAKDEHKICVKSDTDTEDCGLGGVIVISDGRLAITDHDNMSVKIVDVIQCKVLEEKSLDFIPFDLTQIKGGNIAVTAFGRRYIQVFSVSPVLSTSHTITVPGLYTGIEYVPDKFILVCNNPIKGLHICDMSGVLLQQIDTDTSGNKLFTKPTRVAISPDHGTLYITDTGEHAVVSLTMGGHLIHKYYNELLQTPLGATVDDDGYVYVCSYDNSTVHQLSPSGQVGEILLEKKGRRKSPDVIVHHADTLYITSSSYTPGSKNNIKVYSLHR